MMDWLLSSSSWVLSASLVVAFSVSVSLVALYLVRKFIAPESLKKNHDVAGFTFSIIGVLYSVILGFTVINVQTRYNTALETVHTESMVLADLYRDAEFFPPDNSKTIRDMLRKYTEYVLKEEWRSGGQGEDFQKTQALLQEIWYAYYGVNLTNEKVKVFFDQSIAKLDDLMNARLAREFNAWEHLSEMMWSLLLIGAVITVIFMLFFGLDSLKVHMMMTALLSGYLSFMLYLVFSLDHVFQGPEGITPAAFDRLLSMFHCWDL